MLESLKLFSVSLVSFLVLDYIWLGLIAKNIYLKHLATIGRIENGEFKIILWAGVAVYVLMSIGLVYFVIPKVRVESSWLWVFLIGALYGFISYGIYDMTNYATLKDYTLQLSAIDMIWGSVLCGTVTVITKVVNF